MIYVAGHVAFDTLIYCNRFPKANSAVPITGLYDVYGGAAGNTAAAIARLGMSSSLVAMVGEDFDNSDYDKWLGELGVETAHVKVVKNSYTPRAYMPVDSKGNQISFFYWGASGAFNHMLIPRLHPGKEDLIHIATGGPDFNRKLVSAYQKAIISLDPGYDIILYSKQDLEFMLQRIDLLFVNEHEIAFILKRLGKKAPKSLLSYGLEVLVVTEGAKGSNVYTKKEEIHAKAYSKAKYVDPTGAGDSYRAGFLAAFMKGKDLKACAKMGSAVASFVIEHPGAQTCLPTWEQAEKRAKEL
jgi:sugar/nucleoside kinase (ribokinase family)